MDALRDLEVYVDDAIRVFIDKLSSFEGDSLDIGYWVRLFAFGNYIFPFDRGCDVLTTHVTDVIGEVTFSKPFGFVTSGTDNGAFSQIEEALRSASWIGQIPWLYWLHDFLMPVIGNHLGINNRHVGIRGFALQQVKNRKSRGSERKDILSKLFEVRNDRPEQFDDTAVISMAASNIFAGSDTTAISIRAIIYYLLKNPTCKTKLTDEIDRMRATGQLSDPVLFQEADKMPYLQAVIFEAMRLHPAFGMHLPRVVPEEGAVIQGQYIPSEVCQVPSSHHIPTIDFR
jgi:hypothetical protein